MSKTPEERLAALGFELPEPSSPVANYVPWVRDDNLVYISGQVPIWANEVHYKGRVGVEFSLEDGQTAAQMAGLNILVQLKAAVGELSRVKKVLRLNGFVACPPDYTDQPKVINGCSDLMVDVFGEDIGRHTRVAVGVSSLPLGVAVEVDGIFRIG